MKKFIINSIFNKLLIIFLLIIVGLTTILGMFSYYNFRDELLDVAQNHLKIISRQTGSRVHDAVSESVARFNLTDADTDTIFMMAYERIYDNFRISEREVVGQLDFSGNIYMLDQNGKVMLENYYYEWTDDYSQKDFFKEILADDNDVRNHRGGTVATRVSSSGFVTYNRGDAEYVAAYSRVSGVNWILIVDGLKEDILAPAQKVKKTIFIFALIAIIFVTIIVALISRHISKPINKAILFANEIAKGNFAVKPLESRSNDEIGSLVKYLNNMRSNLEEKVDNIENLLNNVGQGFLSFGNDLIVDEEYSQKCNYIFGLDIANEKVIDLLFEEGDKATYEGILFDLFEALYEEDHNVEGYLFLLPKELNIRDKIVDVEYKVICEKEKLIVMLTDVTEKRELESRAINDGLTGLYNHSYFQDILDKEMERDFRYKNSLSLLMLDIDHFKKFNDTYGHQAGDEVLKWLGKLLKKNKRESDIIARYGGEEFAVILPETNIEGAVVAADRINKMVRNMVVKYEGLKLKVTVSIGGTEVREGEIKRDFIKRADTALYKAKEKGRDRSIIE